MQGPAVPSPAPGACTPLRAGYAADLSDAALEAAGATAALLLQSVTFTKGQPYGCLVNGQPFSFPDAAPIELPLGSVVEWEVNRLAVHPL